MRIGLYGILGTYNFGCEAIVRGAYRFAKDMYPECRIIYFSYSYAYDKEHLADLDIEIVEVVRKRNVFKSVTNKVLRRLDAERRIPTEDLDRIFRQADIFFSIGGDIYTIPAVLREQEKYPYYNFLIDFCDRAIRAGKQVVLYGASVGPWGAYQRAVDYYRRALEKYRIILCREMESMTYLSGLGLENMVFFPDPAYFVRTKREEDMPKRYIGINLSPLSLKEIYGEYDAEIIESFARQIESLRQLTGLDIMLIPHVLSRNPHDNDLVFLQELYAHFSEECRSHVVFSDYAGGFLSTKQSIRQCRFVISARMHCAINAIVENVPALFLSYSQKSIGMCKYIYGTDHWVIDLRNLETELVKKTQEINEIWDQLSASLEVRNQEIQEYYEQHTGQLQVRYFGEEQK